MKNEPERDLLDIVGTQTFEERRGFDIDPDFLSDVTAPLLPRKPTVPDGTIALSAPDEEES